MLSPIGMLTAPVSFRVLKLPYSIAPKPPNWLDGWVVMISTAPPVALRP